MSTIRQLLRDSKQYRDEVLITELGGADQSDFILQDEDVDIMSIGVRLIPTDPTNAGLCGILIQAAKLGDGGLSTQFIDLIDFGKPDTTVVNTSFRQGSDQVIGAFQDGRISYYRSFPDGFPKGWGWQYRLSLNTDVLYLGQTARIWTHIRKSKN